MKVCARRQRSVPRACLLFPLFSSYHHHPPSADAATPSLHETASTMQNATSSLNPYTKDPGQGPFIIFPTHAHQILSNCIHILGLYSTRYLLQKFVDIELYFQVPRYWRIALPAERRRSLNSVGQVCHGRNSALSSSFSTRTIVVSFSSLNTSLNRVIPLRACASLLSFH